MSRYWIECPQRGRVGLGWTFLFVLLPQVCSCLAQQSDSSTCSSTLTGFAWKYEDVLASDQYDVMRFDDLPGFTRSVSKHNYALITPESHVWAKNQLWKNGTTAHIISPALGSNFAMYLVTLNPGGYGDHPLRHETERFIVVMKGEVQVTAGGGYLDKKGVSLSVGDFMYMPPNVTHQIAAQSPAALLVFERQYKIQNVRPSFRYGSIDSQPVVPAAGEVFQLRKLMPDTEETDFNIHVMDFMPGEHLNVREVHYNQHGLVLVHGKGIYRLGDDWMPVKKGDSIWMAPYVPQWFAALGTEPARYILYKDTTEDPLYSSNVVL